MDCRSLPFRQLPHQPKLFLEYLDHFEKVKSFYHHPPTMPTVARVARKIDYLDERRAGVASVLRKQNAAFGAEVESRTREVAEFLEKDGGDLLAQYLIESYRAEETYGSAFGKLFARLFATQGLILMDPLDEGLHKVAAPLYQHALAERDVLNEKLLQRTKELDRAGFEATVKVTSKSTLLFSLKDGSRQAITARSQAFQAGDKSWPR